MRADIARDPKPIIAQSREPILAKGPHVNP